MREGGEKVQVRKRMRGKKVINVCYREGIMVVGERVVIFVDEGDIGVNRPLVGGRDRCV